MDSTVLCGTLSVFENRQTNSGRKIELKVVVIPAIYRDKSALPVFCFEGGPGVSATVGASFYADTVNYYRLRHDVVLIDSRGTGGSNPLHCRQLQYKEGLEQQFTEMYPIQAVKECYDSLSKLADLTQYTTSNMAMDAEEVRKWLGYDKINIFGLSFGGRLAQVYLKMFPNSVESCVLWSPAAINSRMPLDHARYADDGLNKLFDDCKNDPLCNSSFPAIREEFQTLMETGKRKPFDYKFEFEDGKEELIAIPWHSFHTKIRSMMYAPMSSRQIPYVVHQSFLGNWQPFISLYPKGGSYNDFIAEGLYLCVTCAEDVPFITKQEADSLTANTSMGDYRIQQQMNACGQWAKGNIPDNFMEPVSSAVPTLLISGYFDPVTPPSMAEEIARTLPNCFLVSIPAMSHTFDGLSNSYCFDKLVVDFLNQPNTKPNVECILQMLPEPYKTM
ncbi:MAG: alpha/beta fold hydrolase [Chryseolinea sp.]